MGLKVETAIPFGNACQVEVLDGPPPTVAFTPDPHGGPECLWFCLRVVRSGRGKGGPFKLALKHVSNLLGAGRNQAALRPVVRRDQQPWERLDAGKLEELPDGQFRLVWILDQPETALDVAVCYPYGSADVQQLVADLKWSSTPIGVSQGGRAMVRLSNDPGATRDERPGLYVVARQHAGETPGSWLLDGLLRRFAALGDDAPLIWAVPLADPDGVEQGHYGKDLFPFDLNRAWGRPAMRHEVLVLQHDLHRWMQRCRPVLALDLHAPGATESDGIYCYLNKPEEYRTDYQLALKWAEAFAKALAPEYAAPVFARTANYRSRWETPRFTDYCRDLIGISALAIETPYALCGSTLMTREHYQQAGVRLADAIVTHLATLPKPNL